MKMVAVIILCHLIGDYVLQCDYIAQTKGKNWYHMFVHCALYCFPFMLAFGIDWRLAFIFISHVVVDTLKARYHKISYVNDQIQHYFVAMIIYLL